MLPTVTCVAKNSDGCYLAYFGYKNLNAAAVLIPAGSNDGISTNIFSDLANRGQTELFQPGTVDKAFSLPFCSGELRWQLQYAGSGIQEATASANSPLCNSGCAPTDLACLGCKGVDISTTQLTLDGASFQQNRLVQSAAKRLLKIGGATHQKAAQMALLQGKNFYLKNWNLAYSLPATIVNCTDTQACSTVNNFPVVDSYVLNALELQRLAKDLAKRLRRAGEKKAVSERIKKRADKYYETAIAITKEVPLQRSQCG